MHHDFEERVMWQVMELEKTESKALARIGMTPERIAVKFGLLAAGAAALFLLEIGYSFALDRYATQAEPRAFLKGPITVMLTELGLVERGSPFARHRPS
jgi:hypothetical protein